MPLGVGRTGVPRSKFQRNWVVVLRVSHTIGPIIEYSAEVYIVIWIYSYMNSLVPRGNQQRTKNPITMNPEGKQIWPKYICICRVTTSADGSCWLNGACNPYIICCEVVSAGMFSFVSIATALNFEKIHILRVTRDDSISKYDLGDFRDILLS